MSSRSHYVRYWVCEIMFFLKASLKLKSKSIALLRCWRMAVEWGSFQFSVLSWSMLGPLSGLWHKQTRIVSPLQSFKRRFAKISQSRRRPLLWSSQGEWWKGRTDSVSCVHSHYEGYRVSIPTMWTQLHLQLHSELSRGLLLVEGAYYYWHFHIKNTINKLC